VTLLSQLGYFIDYCRLFSRRTHNNGTGIEDTALLSVVSKSGARDWAKRASGLAEALRSFYRQAQIDAHAAGRSRERLGRDDLQCRERWAT